MVKAHKNLQCKRGNSKMLGAKKQRPPIKKEATPKHRGLKNKDLQ
jgi:hypothetical protein